MPSRSFLVKALGASALALIGISVATFTAQAVWSNEPCGGDRGDPACARSILFVGNSFTIGQHSIVRRYRPESVTDLNAAGTGGVPALFKRFADQSGLSYRVSVEAVEAKSLTWHLAYRRGLIDRRWDDVVLQEVSYLDRKSPGDPGKTSAAARELARLFASYNREVRIGLVAHWASPKRIAEAAGAGGTASIEAMSRDIERAVGFAASKAAIPRTYKVGGAWICAIRRNVALAHPPDAHDQASKVDLWAGDRHHASTFGYYLEALVIFAGVTGVDPRKLGPREEAAKDLGIPPEVAANLQQTAWTASRPDGCRPAA